MNYSKTFVCKFFYIIQNKHLEFDERGFPGLPEGYTRPDLKKHMLGQNNVFKK